jgi:hypothetical protein
VPIIVCVFSCNVSDKKILSSKQQMRIKLEIIPEDYDSSYSITWNDTVGSYANYNLHNRPFEIWCFLIDKKDTVGSYKGISTPTNYTYFSTRDTSVIATFMIAANSFSDKLLYDELEKYNEGIKTRFQPVTIDIKNNLRKKFELILTE